MVSGAERCRTRLRCIKFRSRNFQKVANTQRTSADLDVKRHTLMGPLQYAVLPCALLPVPGSLMLAYKRCRG